MSPFSSDLHGLYTYPLAATLGVVLWGGIIIRRKTLPFIDIAVAALATYAALSAVRFVPFVGLMGYAIAIRHWGATLRTGTKPLLLERRGALELITFVLLLASTVAYGYPRSSTTRAELGWGRDETICHEEVEFMKRSGLSGVIYNEYEDGALIIHALYPRLKPVSDSRADVYGEQLFNEYNNSLDGFSQFQSYLERYNVSYVLLYKTDPREGESRVTSLLNRPAIAKVLLETESRILFQVLGCSAHPPNAVAPP
jgi:hypothetical protein